MSKEIWEIVGISKEKYQYTDTKFNKWLFDFMEPSWEDDEILRDARIHHIKSKLYPCIKGVWKDFFGVPMPDMVLRAKMFDVYQARCRRCEENIRRLLNDEELTASEKMFVISHNSSIWNSELEELMRALDINIAKNKNSRRNWA